jgi:hypothetical protein
VNIRSKIESTSCRRLFAMSSEIEGLRTVATSPSETQPFGVVDSVPDAATDFGQDCHLMPRRFAYDRVSTAGQTAENQIREIASAGFKVDTRRVQLAAVTAIRRRRIIRQA